MLNLSSRGAIISLRQRVLQRHYCARHFIVDEIGSSIVKGELSFAFLGADVGTKSGSFIFVSVVRTVDVYN